MQAHFQTTTYNPHVSHMTDKALSRSLEHESRASVEAAYSHLQLAEGFISGDEGKKEVHFNLHPVGEENSDFEFALTETEEGGIHYAAGKEIEVRILENIDEADAPGYAISEGAVVANEGVLLTRQYLTAVSREPMMSVDGPTYAVAYGR